MEAHSQVQLSADLWLQRDVLKARVDEMRIRVSRLRDRALEEGSQRVKSADQSDDEKYSGWWDTIFEDDW